MTTSPASHRILVLDRDDANLVFVRYMLTALGLDFDIATTGDDAVKFLNHQAYGAILLDYKDSPALALEILAWIKINLPAKPVIIVSANDPSRQTIQRFFDVGCDHFVQRPLTARKLCDLIPDLIYGPDDQGHTARTA